MNRGFITPQNGIALPGPVTQALITMIEERQASPKRLVSTTTDLDLEYDGKRYSGSATASAVGDVQWDIQAVTPVSGKASKAAPKKAAAKKAAPKKAAAKKGSGRK